MIQTHFAAGIVRNPLLAAVLRFLNPSYSYCQKCRVPWNYCNSKTVYTSERRGTFATCDICWNNSTLNKLKEYYTIVYKEQEKGHAGSEYKMGHTLEHLLKCVEIEYDRTK